MGRQLPIVAIPEDERELLRFIRTLSPIRVYGSSARSVEALWAKEGEEENVEGFTLNCWLKAFPWEPKYLQTGGPRCPKERAGWWYVSNGHDAPVIEIDRSHIGPGGHGRVYWAKDFCAPNGLAYDAVAFGRIVDRIWNYIRRNSVRRGHDGSTAYYLPNAWREFGARMQ